MTINRYEIGPRLCQTVVHGDTIYLAGQVADKTASGPVAEQTAEILGMIDTRLAAVGSDKSKILSANIFLSDIRTFDEMNAVWDKWVPQGNTPARACVQATLARPKFAVEIIIIAAK